MVKLNEVEPFSGMLAAPNALTMTGALVAVTEALDVLPVPPLAEITCTLLFFTPPVTAVTLTEKVQELLVANVAPARMTDEDPAVAVIVPPPQEPANALGVATTRPAGRLSVNATPVNATAFATGLLMVKLSEVEPFNASVAAPNDLVITGGLATVTLAVAVLPVPPFVELTAPEVLVKFPDTEPVAFTVSVQLLLAATVPPVSETLAEPATAVAVPPQVLVSPLGVATTIPAGNVSENATPVSATALAAGFVIVKVSEVVALRATAVGLNALAIDGGATTARLAEAVPPVPPSVEVTAPVVLFCVPAAVPVTFTEKVHELLTASAAPARLIAFVPDVATIVPAPHVPT